MDSKDQLIVTKTMKIIWIQNKVNSIELDKKIN
jgi:hypothetical protein